MNIAALSNSIPVFVEIGVDWLRARRGREGVEVRLERAPDRRLTATARERVITALRSLVNAKSWLPRPRAWCAISSRGVSLRRLSLPDGDKDEFYQRLRLQVESEFPLAPEELAWGWQPIGQPKAANGEPGRQEVLVAAARRELVADYHEIMQASGTHPVFTLAALARWHYCGQGTDSHGLLDVGDRQAELTIFENGVPTSSRLVFWNGTDAGGVAAASAGIQGQMVPGNGALTRLLLTGRGASSEFADRLSRALNHSCRCERVEVPAGRGDSAAVAGLAASQAQGHPPALTLGLAAAAPAGPRWSNGELKKWCVRGGVLAVVLLLFPYAEALLLKPHLERKVAAFKAESERLTVIDREMDFLGDLKLSQPPYLDLLFLFSKSVPPGTHFDSLSLNSHGEVSLRGAFHDGQQVADFRNKLIASGFFTNVVVEEQVPSPDRQKVSVRVSALERSAAQMQVASARLLAEAKKEQKAEKAGNANPPPGAPASGKESR